jgi:serine/threonine protein kinase
MWSLGVITLCLLTGNPFISFEELQDMNQADIAAKLVQASHDYPPWSQQGKDFIKKLIVLEPLKRMTAKEAVGHDWFRKPTRIAVELDKLYERSLVFWSKRPNYISIVEDLPDVLPKVIRPKNALSNKGSNVHRKLAHKKIPDAASPYFSLERHLHPRGAPNKSSLYSQRKRMLEDLNAGSPFIDTTEQPERGAVTKLARLKSSFRLQREELDTDMTSITSPIRRPKEPSSTDTAIETLTSQLRRPIFTVLKGGSIANNGLGASADGMQSAIPERPTDEYDKTRDEISVNKAQRRQPSPEISCSIRQVDACDLFGTTPIEIKAAEAAEAERAAYDDFQSFLDNEDEEMEYNSVESPPKTHTRSYSISQDDREMYDEAAKDLPKLSTAKAFPQAIARRKQLKGS